MLKKVKHHVGIHLPALKSWNFRLYFFGQGTSLIGTWLATVAEQWLIYPVLTNNQSLLGVVSAANLIPTAALVLFAGVISDRVNKRKFVIILQSLFLVIYLVLAGLVFTHHIQVWHVMVAAFIGGALFAFDMPTRNSMVLDLVDREHYASALSLNAGIFNAARAIGPALAGFMIASIGIAAAYFLNSLSFVAVIVSVYFIKIAHEHHESTQSFFHGLKEGFIYVGKNKVILALLVNMGILAFWIWPLSTLLAVFAHDIYKTGEVGFGFLQSFSGLGAVIAAFSFYTVYQKVKNKYLLLVIPTILSGLATLGFAFSSNFPIALLFQFLNGLFFGIVFSAVGTMIQVRIPGNLRGRIMSFSSLTMFGAMPLGALVISLVIDKLGPRTTFMGGAIMLLISAALLYIFAGKKFEEKLHHFT